jgi:urease accessory protein
MSPNACFAPHTPPNLAHTDAASQRCLMAANRTWRGLQGLRRCLVRCLGRLGRMAAGVGMAVGGFTASGVAMAHEATGVAGGFASGLLHPLAGPDHLVAMVAVGLWGAFLGRPALWLLPVVFPLVMAAGGAAGVLGLPLPAVEVGIALSAIALGAAVACGWRAPLALAAAIVAAFAVFHGHAHGTELPQAADPLAYSLGFVVSTGLLHLCGIAFGELTRWPWGARAVQGLGALIAVVGAVFLVRAF